MRKIILAMQMSLDGFVEGDNGDMSFLNTQDHSLWEGVFRMIENVDTCVMGRVMFPGYRDYWKSCLKPGTTATADEVKYATWADKTQHIVFSKTLKDPQWQNTRVVSSPVVDEIRKLKSSAGGDIYVVGGAMLGRTVLDAGLADEYRLTIAPILVGKGKSLLNPLSAAHKLKPVKTEQLKSGSIVLNFQNA
ncbi:MAG TPA: dihydrofolate reductase family protein [Cyclobacteriaceae bacterium]|nr:dihydrofolate reductase family protein [Cyclobacteriaceae bacterium]